MKILLLWPKFPATFWSFKSALPFIAKKAEKISGPHYAYTIIQVIHAYIKESKTLCQMHQRVEPGLEECTLCYE